MQAPKRSDTTTPPRTPMASNSDIGVPLRVETDNESNEADAGAINKKRPMKFSPPAKEQNAFAE